MNAFARSLAHLALLTCPKAFRDEYGAEIAADFDDQTAPFAMRLASIANLVATGIMLRAENVARDLGFALRTFAKAPVFVLVAVSATALAIAVNVAVGSLTEHVYLDPLPYPQAHRIAYVYATVRGDRNDATAYADVRDFIRQNRTFVAIGSSSDTSGTLTRPGSPLALRIRAVGGAYFDVLGVRPQIGRFLTAGDATRRRIVISDDLWRRRFGGNASALGRTVVVDDVAYTIAGVAPAHALDPASSGTLESFDAWISIDDRSSLARDRNFYDVETIGRLAPGATLAGANADLNRIARRLQREFPASNRERGVGVVALADAMMGPFAPLVLLFHAAALVVFAIAAANVASLLLARAASRERELVVRRALGATARRIAAQLTAEMLLLVVAGSAIGVFLGWIALAWLHASIDRLMPAYVQPLGWRGLGIDLPLLAYVVGLAAIFTFVAGTLPALARRANASGIAAGSNAPRVRRILVAAQTTLAVVLAIVAGLLLRSFFTLERTSVGFDGTNLYWAGLPPLPSDRYASDSAVRIFVESLNRSVRTLPGVRHSAAAMTALFGSNNLSAYRLAGEPASPHDPHWVAVNAIVPGYFDTMGIPVLRGRDFDDRDAAKAQPVAIVSERFARKAFGTIDAAVGLRVAVATSAYGTGPLRRIAGVVGDVRHHSLEPPAQEVYVPFAQAPLTGGFVLRTNERDGDLADSLTAAVRELDAKLPPVTVTSFTTLRDLDAVPTMFAATILTTSAAIALLLALFGIYGLVAYSVERRTREFGIRTALGARPRRIVATILRETVALIGVALAIGVVLSIFAARLLAQYLVETAPVDAVTFTVVVVLVIACSVAAATGPARRAVAVDPAEALRHE